MIVFYLRNSINELSCTLSMNSAIENIRADSGI